MDSAALFDQVGDGAPDRVRVCHDGRQIVSEFGAHANAFQPSAE